MRALYLTGPNELKLTDIPKPIPSANEAVIKVTHAGLCHTDVDIRNGDADWVNYPTVPGHEFSGIVDSCGESCQYIKPGDRVGVHIVIYCGQCTACRLGDPIGCDHRADLGSMAPGGFAEYCAVPARFLYKIPEHVTLEEAAMLEPLANAVSAVRHMRIEPGQRVVVIGPGPIGLLVVNVARMYGPSSLTLVGTRDERLAVGKQMGATHIINVKKTGEIDVLKRKILRDKGADVIVRCTDTQSAIDLAFDIMGRNCRIGLEGGGSAFPIPLSALQACSASMIGINGWSTRDFAQALELIAERRVDVNPIITQRFPLEQWEEAFEMITTRKSESLKVLITLE